MFNETDLTQYSTVNICLYAILLHLFNECYKNHSYPCSDTGGRNNRDKLFLYSSESSTEMLRSNKTKWTAIYRPTELSIDL